MKNFYGIMLMVSILCMAGDCDNFMIFLIWHAVWFMAFLISVKKLEGAE